MVAGGSGGGGGGGFVNDDSSIVVVPPVAAAANRHGMAVFLVANLLTGLVNLTVPTLEVDDPYALLVVFGYVCIVGGAALVLDAVFPPKKRPDAAVPVGEEVGGSGSVIGSRTTSTERLKEE
jgi:hypothetical protein